jgi:phenylpyruvate tautomerase
VPYLQITTNAELGPSQELRFLAQASEVVAKALGKDERYVMVSLNKDQPTLLAGRNDPLAFLELKSIGLPEAETASLSEALCKLMNEGLAIRADRVYIEFTRVARHMWGWNAGTF